MVAAGRFQFARRANTLEITVEPDFQEQARGKRRPAPPGRRHDELERGQIQLLDKLAQEARRMIGRHPVFERGRKKKLLTVIGSHWMSHDARSDPSDSRSVQKTFGVLRQSLLSVPFLFFAT